MAVEDLAHASECGRRLAFVQVLAELGIGEISPGDHPDRDGGAGSDRLQDLQLAQGVGRQRLDVDRTLDDDASLTLLKKLGQQIASGNRGVVADERDRGLFEMRIEPGRQVPQVNVGIDNP